jgi:hypothetical protein
MKPPARRRTEINAVYEEDIPGTLEAMGLREEYESGRLRCTICGQSVADGGLGAARRSGSRFQVACRRLDCVRKLSEGGNE